MRFEERGGEEIHIIHVDSSRSVKKRTKGRHLCFRGTPGLRGWLKKAKRTQGPINTKEKRGREVKKDKTNRARRRVKAKRSDVDLEFLTREFHPRIVPVEEERVQSDIKKGQFSFLQVDALVTPSVD